MKVFSEFSGLPYQTLFCIVLHRNAWNTQQIALNFFYFSFLFPNNTTSNNTNSLENIIQATIKAYFTTSFLSLSKPKLFLGEKGGGAVAEFALQTDASIPRILIGIAFVFS